MKSRNNLSIAKRLVQLVKPLSGFMTLAIFMGTVGHLCAAFITILGGYGILNLLNFALPFSLTTIFVCLCVFALLRGALHYAEQACNHFIAFKLLALIRDKVFIALRKLCPAKLEGKDKGNLITVITSDIELLEVFYAHTISPIAIAFLMSVIMSLFIGSFHPTLGILAALAYITVGAVIPFITSAGRSSMLFPWLLLFMRGLPCIRRLNTSGSSNSVSGNSPFQSWLYSVLVHGMVSLGNSFNRLARPTQTSNDHLCNRTISAIQVMNFVLLRCFLGRRQRLLF